MSQYTFRIEHRYEIVIGWDNPLESFFVQVWDGSSDEDDPVLWMGAKPGEVATVEALAAFVRPYGEIPGAILARLREDVTAREPLTDWQLKMRATVVKA